MQNQKYSVIPTFIETVLNWVKSGEIAIPEIQRPFVWDSTKVRDLMDSLYRGFPVGYIIAWKNPNVRLKDGSFSQGKKVLIDGQQRVTALTAAVLGAEVVTKEYKKTRVQIAFHPVEERFEVFNTAIKKDAAWISDIAPLISGEERIGGVLRAYLANNPSADELKIEDNLEKLKSIVRKSIGLIELDADLDIETVTEIFIRINSKGVVLSQADFVMSKIAADERYGGSLLRKCIDYFSHLAIAPEFYAQIAAGDTEFAKTEFFQKISWLKNNSDDLYDPGYTDILRVAFTSEFNRGKLSDLVSLLSGRDFERRAFVEEIAEQSFAKLKRGILNFVSQTHFERFVMIVKSAGFADARLIAAQNALNFAYVVYLKMRSLGADDSRIQRAVKKWLVFALLTNRYSGKTETTFEEDIKQIAEKGFEAYFAELEAAQLSEAFWNVGLIQQLTSSGVNNSAFSVFLAAQCRANAKGFLSRDITVRDMILHRGDVHHIFPKDVLKKKGFSRSVYNQIANFVYAETAVNIKIGNKPPEIYFDELAQQTSGGAAKYGAIAERAELMKNFAENAVPASIFRMTTDDYETFLAERRVLMAQAIKNYYETL